MNRTFQTVLCESYFREFTINPKDLVLKYV